MSRHPFWQATTETMISLTHVSKTFDGGRSYAVKNLSFEVDIEETVVLLGSSDCGIR